MGDDPDTQPAPPTTARRAVTVINTYGLHMRPSTRFVTLAGQYQSEVAVKYEGRTVNGRSILDMTTLAAPCGAVIELETRGPDALAALEALVALVEAGFHMAAEEH